MNELVEIGTNRILRCAEEGPLLSSPRDGDDFIGEAFSVGANVVAIPARRLGPGFLKLATGLAGEVLQKFVNYNLKCAIVGDISEALARSAPLRDFVRETNKGSSIWFVADFEALRAKLAG